MDVRVLVVPLLPGGGITTYTVELATALSNMGADVHLIGRSGDAEFDYKERGSVTPKIRYAMNDPFFTSFQFGRFFTKLIQKLEFKPDIVHCTTPTVAPFVREHRVPMVCTGWFYPHNLPGRLSTVLRLGPVHFERLGELLGQVEYFTIDHLGYRSSRRIIAVTRSLFANLSRLFPNKVCYIPPGICVDECDRSRTGHRTAVAFVAHDLDNPRKGAHLLLRSAAMLHPQIRQEVDLWFIGGYSKRFREFGQHLTKSKGLTLNLFGHLTRAEIRKLLGAAEIIVCPSLYEEFGYVALEGMAKGLPILASRIQSFEDIVAHEKNGFLFSKGNAEELSDYLQLLLSDVELRERMGRESKRIARERFDWGVLAREVLTLYEGLMENQTFQDQTPFPL